MTEPSRRNDRTPRDTRSIVRTLFTIVLVLIVVVFVADNRQSVRVGWIVGDGRAPLIVVLVITALIGVVIGLLISALRRRGDDSG